MQSTVLFFFFPCLVLARQGSTKPCDGADARRAAARLGCIEGRQLEEILSFPHPATNERIRSQGLTSAFELASCVNDFKSFPSVPEERTDYQCLQSRLLDFYERLWSPVKDSEMGLDDFRFQDHLAWASLRIHYCMIDESLPISGCLSHIENALEDYRQAFRKAVESQKTPSQESARLAGEDALPDFSHLQSFVDLCLENARRYPLALGRQIGVTLGSVLCDAYDLYPQKRNEIAFLYNVLIRFDDGNMGSSRQLYQFLLDLKEVFRPGRKLPTSLYLTPPDWSGSPRPCSQEDWTLVFPEFHLHPGYLLPGPVRMGRSLEHLETLLVKTAEFSENPNHLWKPFQRYGLLLFQLGQSLRASSYQDTRSRELRDLIMGKARDALLLKGVWEARYPVDPRPLRASITQVLRSYCGELLGDLRVYDLIAFADQALDTGQALLDDRQKEYLHRQMAIAYSLLRQESKALTHLQESDLKQSDLDRILDDLKSAGVRDSFWQQP